jgi:ATP-binding cassette subfamily C protein LapB
MLFLDEPTGSMDTQTELYFIEHLKTALEPDQTLMVATHRHNMLSILTRLIVIDGGKILADGPRDEVLKHLTASAAAQQAASTPKEQKA